jgi:hypothetical protein
MVKNGNSIKIISIVIISILIIISLLPTMSSENITQFGKSGSEVLEPDVTYDLESDNSGAASMEATGYFEIPSHRGEIKEASLKIKLEPNGDSYLTDPGLDIGLDGDYEWEFSGRGYGQPGHQEEFSSGTGKRNVVTANRGGGFLDNRSYILLPTTADINSASMKIKGGPGQYKEDLVVGVYYWRGQLYYTKSNRDGTFTSPKFYTQLYSGTSWAYYYGLGLGDFDNDNDLDIVYGEKSNNRLGLCH